MNHFISHDIMAELGGQGKAMIVTSGREAAVKYQLAFQKYFKDHSITSIGTLIAFSGKVDYQGSEYTESQMNQVKEDYLKDHLIRKTTKSWLWQISIRQGLINQNWLLCM